MKLLYFFIFIIFTSIPIHSMNVLIIGSGGREHALAWKIAKSPHVAHIFVAPGNAGTAQEPKTKNIALAATDIPALVLFAQQNAIHLTIVGPEAALEAGIVDAFEKVGLPCLGPTQKAARIETSKAFAKDFMQRHKIPTARYAIFTDIHAAQAYIHSQPLPLVIKADGLAAGKGVIIAYTYEQACIAAQDMLSGKAFGIAGTRIVIEEFLEGKEVSFIVLTDGQHIVPLQPVQDYKKAYNNDKGPNTGGMGAYSPVPFITQALHNHIMNDIIKPTIQGLAAESTPFVGFLFAGLMITPAGVPKVLEFNCRLGDPETQVLMMRLQSDFTALCTAVLNKKLCTYPITWNPHAAVCVVLTAPGYPNTYRTGDCITGLENNNDPLCSIFHGGTKQTGKAIVTAGGRILAVTAYANNLSDAHEIAYANVKKIYWPGMQYRTDIGLSWSTQS